jgi:hypothetical protein
MRGLAQTRERAKEKKDAIKSDDNVKGEETQKEIFIK